jgi:hypothetical protein
LAVGIVLAAAAGSAMAGEPVEGKNNKMTLDGVLWSSYRYYLEDFSTTNASKDINGFTIDRVYFTMTSQLTDRITGRARIEAQNANQGEIRTFLKTADLQVKEPFGLKDNTLRFGQTEGLISNFLERFWGYRIVSKTVTDRYFDFSTTWLGAGLNGKWAGGMVETDVVIMNHVAYDEDVTDGHPKYKALGGRVYVMPIKEGAAKGLGFGGYAQYAPVEHPSAENNVMWYGAHAFLEGEKFVAGVEYDSRKDKVSDQDLTGSAISFLGRYKANEKIEVFGRVDMVDPNTDVDEIVFPDQSLSHAATMNIMLGLSHSYAKTLRSIVDVSVRQYSDDIFQKGPPKTSVDYDSEIIFAARLEAKL